MVFSYLTLAMNLFKMNKSHYTLLLILISVLFVERAFAQSYTAGDQITLHVNDFCLIETNHAPVNLTLSTAVAGTPVTSVSNSDMYVKISSIVPWLSRRLITARLVSGAVPPGTRLTLISAPCTTANSGGRRGTPVSTPIVLSSTDQTLVTGIGSCYTGTGYNDGYKLTYTWGPYNPATDYDLMQATTNPVILTIVLTITDHNWF
jgi:hypothetical protein